MQAAEAIRQTGRHRMISDLLQIALRDSSAYDELSADGMAPRPHWQQLIRELQQIGSEELIKRWARAERRIRENGITYNIYDDALGANRPWRIDPIPFLIAPDEWRYIEAGIKQRAQLLNLLLEDFYGSQSLITGGRIPAELLFANPAFLRPLAASQPAIQPRLHIVAIDLARSPDGQWWVLADRAQAPSGAGYALENRTIVADVLPDLFRNSNIRRLAPFFRAHRDALIRLSGSENPRIVLLTPGPYNETYFEHSYLARYLGLILVEGADLTVRNRRVYLKTVEGLRQVDVILRRVDDSFCDPLELRSDSFLGVPGLVDAVIAGNVKVANSLGSGLIETTAIMPFLPGLARHLLSESLKLPSVATWWCGQDYALEWVLDHLDKVIVKPAFPARGMEPVFGAELASVEKQDFEQRLRARPFEYVAQEQVALSTAPVWDVGHLYSRSLVLRTYVLNTGQDWVAMPGGLVRVAGSDRPVVSMQKGGHSKDVWVLSDGPMENFSMLPPRNQSVELRRASVDLPSRVADNLFWLGRYTERAESVARVIRTLITRVRRAGRSELNCLIRLHGCLQSTQSGLPKKTSPTALELEAELLSLIGDSKRTDSLIAILGEVLRVGGNLRERLSADMTRVLGQLTDSIAVDDYMLFVEYSAVLTGCLEVLSAISGMERENVTRGPGWLFMSLGRRLERAMYCTRQLREVAKPLAEQDWPILEYLLEVGDSSMTYRSRYFTTLQPIAVLDVLMADETNPRSLMFQLTHLVDLYRKLPRHVPADLRAMRRALSRMRSFDLQNLELPLPGGPETGESEESGRLEKSLRQLEKLLPSWSNNLSHHYFSHSRALPSAIG